MKSLSSSILALGIPPVIRAGIESILGDVAVEAASCFSALGARSRAILLVSDVEFVKHADFFMANRRRVIVLAGESRAEGDPKTISLNDAPERIAAVFAKAIAEAFDSGEERCTALSARETDVLKAIASGLSYKEIADRLSISVNTVVTHRKNISSKLGIRSNSGLSVYALMHGLI